MTRTEESPVLNEAHRSASLQRRLTQRQLSMIAIGGAIGVGLFLGSSVTIELAGPGVIITYLFGAVVGLFMAYALAVRAVARLVSGVCGLYGGSCLIGWAGFSVGVTYALVRM